jgi:DNA polymerase V
MKIFGLMDCNNFFVSCERVFDPSLISQPVLVLSSNDGCVVARSNESKKIGIPMGIPVFKIKNLIKDYNIKLRSTNFELYRDMSARVMNIVREFADGVEVYSIDEAFFDLNSCKDPGSFCIDLRKKILQYTGIPVSIGIAPTKTLAKLANRIAKAGGEVYRIRTEHDRMRILKQTPAHDIWGIGQKNSEKLNNFQIKTAFEFQNQENAWLKKNFSIRAVDLADELRGKPAFLLSEKPTLRKSIISSKSFRVGVTDFIDLSRALTNHIEKGAKQLREEGLVAQKLNIYIDTSRFQKNCAPYHGERQISLEAPTDNTLELAKQVKNFLPMIYKSGLVYKKTGVCLSGLISNKHLYSKNLFGTSGDNNQIICGVMDSLNEKYGDSFIQLASSMIKIPVNKTKIKTDSSFRSNRYTTNWDEILSI